MQSRLPIKWKIFRVVNFLHLLGVVFMLLLVLYSFITFSYNTSSTEILVLALFITGGATLLANCICNHHLLEKVYPDKQVSKSFSVFSIIILVLTCIILLFLTITLSTFFYISYNNRSVSVTTLGKMILSVLLAIMITGFYTCIFQVVLRVTIRRNYKRIIDNFLNIDT